MAKPNSSLKFLARLFDRTLSPVYVVNSDYVIAYANESCARWVGVELGSLVSATCVYTSQDLNEIQNRVQGLCPPPETLEQLDCVDATPRSFVALAIQDNDQKSWRSAMICPLIDADLNHLGVLVVCQPQELPNDPDDTQAFDPGRFDDAEKLHAALANIRTQADRIYCLESLVGTSPFAHRLRRQVTTSIETNADLLIVGPQGSGKEHLSRTIHSARNQNRGSELLPVHCSIADQELIQQNIKDIVGSRSAISRAGAAGEQDWLLLLDVDRLGEAAQNELLGFFQLPDFPLRTIATSSVSLIELAEQHQYSTDLAHHLSTFTVELVALSKRRSDIPVLAQALIERDNFRRDRQLSGFSNRVMQQFIEFDWPENIDQLNRTIQIAARTTSGTKIDESDLPDEFHQALRAMQIGTAVESEIVLDRYLREIEKELVVRALKQAKGNKTKAARLLGISRPKLLRRLQFFLADSFEAEPMESSDDDLDPSAFEELD